jgi:vitamin B12 transporter
LRKSMPAFDGRHSPRSKAVDRGSGSLPGRTASASTSQRSRFAGIEASGEARTGAWSLRAGASLTDAKVKAAGPAAALDGLRPAQTPDLILTGGASWEKDRRSASLAIRHVGSQFEDDLNGEKFGPATTIDALLGWPLGRRAQLILRGENLLDETVVAGIADDGAVERVTPRTVWVGLRVVSR